MISNLMSEVQLFSTHGYVDNILLKGSAAGITIGNSMPYGMTEDGQERTMLGINDVARNYWENNTKLVTYMACNTAGTNGIDSDNSLTYLTVDVGRVRMCVGFKKKISYSLAAVDWSANYNNYLASGFGVLDSVNYANTYTYNDNRIYSNHIVYNSSMTTPNMKLGRYAESASSHEIQSIETNCVKNEIDNRNILKNQRASYIYENDEDIFDIIQDLTGDFNKENYKISRENSTITDVYTGKTDMTEYIDVRLHIGDFYTNAAYTVVAKDNNIIAIYDNNIDLEKQKKALENENEYIISEDILNAKKQITEEIECKMIDSKNTSLENKEPYRYFYDIENDIKYLEVNYENEVISENGKKSIASDARLYEI